MDFRLLRLVEVDNMQMMVRAKVVVQLSWYVVILNIEQGSHLTSIYDVFLMCFKIVGAKAKCLMLSVGFEIHWLNAHSRLSDLRA